MDLTFTNTQLANIAEYLRTAHRECELAYQHAPNSYTFGAFNAVILLEREFTNIETAQWAARRAAEGEPNDRIGNAQTAGAGETLPE